MKDRNCRVVDAMSPGIWAVTLGIQILLIIIVLGFMKAKCPNSEA